MTAEDDAFQEFTSDLKRILEEAGEPLLDRPAQETMQWLQDLSGSLESTDQLIPLLALGMQYIASPFDKSRPRSRRLGDLLARLASAAAMLLASATTPQLLAARRALPGNWSRLAPGDLGTAISLARDELICVAWVPDAETVGRLLDDDGPPAAREALLVARQSEILEHAQEQLLGAMDAALANYARLAQRSCDALAAGHHEAAHALAVDVANGVIEQVMPPLPGGLPNHVRRLDPATGPARAFTRSLVLTAAGPAFQSTKSGQVPETRLNRHVTCHVAPAAQFSKANAVRAVLLAVALILDENAFRAWNAEDAPDS